MGNGNLKFLSMMLDFNNYYSDFVDQQNYQNDNDNDDNDNDENEGDNINFDEETSQIHSIKMPSNTDKDNYNYNQYGNLLNSGGSNYNNESNIQLNFSSHEKEIGKRITNKRGEYYNEDINDNENENENDINNSNININISNNMINKSIPGNESFLSKKSNNNNFK